jgi:heterodisulfide reductase subunit B
MDRLVETLGAQAVDWGYKVACCGGSLSLSTLDIALDLSQKILANALECGADIIATACPLCHANLDLRQDMINDQYAGEFDIPVVYFTQLMGVAYGFHARTLGLEKHRSDAIGLLKRKRLLYA